MAITLFQKNLQVVEATPLESEHRYAYSGANPRAARTADLGGIGDFFSDLLKHGENLADTVLGTKATRESQQNAVKLAELRAQAEIESARSSAATWQKITPWLAIGGAALGLGVLYVLFKK